MDATALESVIADTAAIKKVVAYLRVSTDEQAQHGHSLDVQRKKLAGYADLYDLEIVEFVVDEGESAKDLERPGMRRALAMLDADLADGLLVAKLDRLSRSVEDMEHLISRYFGGSKASLKKALYSVGNQVNVLTASGRLALRIQVATDAYEREVIGERTSEALQHLKAQGQALGNPTMEYLVEPETLAVIKSLHDRGEGTRGIAAYLNHHGYKKARGGAWTYDSVQRALKRIAVVAASTSRSEPAEL